MCAKRARTRVKSEVVPTLDAQSVLGDRYRIVRLVGEGAMGEVYEARDERGEQGQQAGRVALKVLPLGTESQKIAEFRARFDCEAALGEQLHHPNVVGVLGRGVDEARRAAFLVMPFLEGRDLAALLEETNVLAPAIAVPLIVQACRGLQAVHDAGIVHRDVKGSNLFLSTSEDQITVSVMDFGLAKIRDDISNLTASGMFMGTVLYASPEQAISAKNATARSDVWSLAMTLYRALCGRPAFTEFGHFTRFLIEPTKAVPPIQNFAPWIEGRLARALHSALIRDPALRCPSALEWRLALEMAIGVDAARAPIKPGMLAPMQRHGVPPAPVVRMPSTWSEMLRG